MKNTYYGQRSLCVLLSDTLNSGYPTPVGGRVSNVSWCGQVAHSDKILYYLIHFV